MQIKSSSAEKEKWFLKMAKKWSCIVITCPSSSSVAAVRREIEFMQKENRLPSGVDVLAIEDPAENIGSGAATLNALVIATEFLSVQQDYMVVTADVLSDAYILIFLHGRNYLYNSCGKPFISMPSEWFGEDSHFSKVGDYVTNLEVLFHLINELQCDSLPGVWVCSTDMLLSMHNKVSRTRLEKASDAVMFCVPAEESYACNHGTVHIDDDGSVADIIYCGSKETIQKYKRNDGCVPLVSGIVFLSTSVAESLLSLHALSPLDSCTYMGLDSGADPIQVSLFFDILVAMCTKISRGDFLSGRCGKVYNVKAGFSKECMKMMSRARSLVWEELSKYRMVSEILEGYCHIYWSDQLPGFNHLDNLYFIKDPENHGVSEVNGNLDPGNIFINSIVESDKSCNVSSRTVVCNSHLELNECEVGKTCLISGITKCNISGFSLRIPSDTVVLGFNVKNHEGSSTVAAFGIHDDPVASMHLKGSTFANRPWSDFFSTFGIKENNLWSSSTERKNKNLMNAKLYPIGCSVEDVLWLVQGNSVDNHCVKRWKSSKKLSLAEMIQAVDHSQEFNFQRQIYAEIVSRKIKTILLNNEDQGLLKYFHAACAENWHNTLISTLDSVLEYENNTVVLTRALSCMADLLGTMAGKIGGLRSGPGGNKSWASAFDHLQNGNVSAGMKALKEERMKWIDRPDRLMRAARHYERAAQILIQNSVKTAREFMKFSLCPVPEMNEWVIAECPVRIDLQGGWTDTPPICYELGGSVVNISVLVDGKKPIGAKAQRIREPSIVLKIGLDELSSELVIEDVKDLLDYDQPNAEGALLKAAIICADIVNINSDLPLWEQLLKKLNGGIEVHSWSYLPQGCGMGGSSILAGAIIAVLLRVSGKAINNSSIIHAVLGVEQLLTTGGGWQDQVGGLMGGINRGYSEASLPLHVSVKTIPVSSSFVEILNRHLLLINTGKVRLAKNLLQNVIRNWYARNTTIVDCFKELLSSSLQLEEAFKKEDLEQVGSLMNKYWQLKKVLAPGCEPASVKDMMRILDPVCYGQLLAGAGGGGFMCILTKQPDAIETVKDLISSIKSNQKISVHRPTICFKGLDITTC